MEIIKVTWKRPDFFTLGIIAVYFGALALGLWAWGLW